MTSTVYACCDERRRDAIAAQKKLNGIDFVEVADDPGMPNAERQRALRVTFVNPLAQPLALGAEHFRIDGGERIRTVAVERIAAIANTENKGLELTVASPGDSSFYTLHVVRKSDAEAPPDGFDPVLSRVRFSFKAECPSDFDCRPVRECPPVPVEEPVIDYLAKDYASFRRLVLDRMALLVPGWTERSPADLGVALVELLAYVGDQLSYSQDAVATEAYLHTARRRASVRRLARLVDYRMHDGCNARTWVHVEVSAKTTLPPGTQLLTTLPGVPKRIVADSGDHQDALRHATVFETIGRFPTKEETSAPGADVTAKPVALFPEHNRIEIYTWGDQRCCLPKGATRATLTNKLEDLRVGDVLIFVERVGPLTGLEADADPNKRHAVRLTEVRFGEDPLGGQLLEPKTPDAIPVTEIAWHRDDALPFPLCVSSRRDGVPEGRYFENVSVALGNVVLADHGRTIAPDSLGTVPDGRERRVQAERDRCDPKSAGKVPPRFRPRLRHGPLTHAARVKPQMRAKKGHIFDRWPYDPDAPAAAALRWKMDDVRPAIWLENQRGIPWTPERDLLSSDPSMRHFVVESEDGHQTELRFGDDECGQRPNERTAFTATYRIGNGLDGNIGAGALTHIVSADSAFTGATNPLPTQGGREPETIEEVRQRAPFAFRTQERAVTLADYEEVARRHPEVQKAVARHRWTGSWYTVFLAIDRLGGGVVDAAFVREIRSHLERFRLAGRDLEIGPPEPVSLEIAMQVCADPSYLASEVERALLRVFGASLLPDGSRGVFHPDNFTFGDSVFLSRLYARAHSVPGVVSVKITAFQRQGKPATSALDSGVLALEWREIARLDNDPNFPERGVFTVAMEDHA